MNQIVIGKRVPIGSAITGIATAIASFYPEYATAIVGASIPVTFLAQAAWVNLVGVTTK